MGAACAGSLEEREAALRDVRLSKQIVRDEKISSAEFRVMLAGTGDSGKSTIVRQMQILHGGGFSTDDRAIYARRIRRCAVEALQSAVVAARDSGIAFRDRSRTTSEAVLDDAAKTARRHAQRALRLGSSASTPGGPPPTDALPASATSLSAESKKAVNALLQTDTRMVQTDKWSSNPEMRASLLSFVEQEKDQLETVLARGNEFNIPDSAAYYFFQRLSALLDPEYTPTDEDILRLRQPTTGVSESRFQSSGVVVKLTDVGGQRGERRKWIHSMEGVNALLFVASLSEYDQRLVEDPSKKRMEESLQVFQDVVSLRWFQKTPMILFLNKLDIFERKIKLRDVGTYFPSYLGAVGDGAAALAWIQHKYKAQALGHDKQGLLFVHTTQATDTNQIDKVWRSVAQSIINSALGDGGFI